MSDTEDGSDGDVDGGDDGFDKEAEREKLREQYEADQKRREATQQMSELLLKGATMTNQHCEECGSPIFRYEGEAFCPTCAGTRDVAEGDARRPDQGPGADQADASADPDREQGDPGGRQPTEPGGRQPADVAPAPGDTPRAASEDAASGAGSSGGELDEGDLEAARARLDERVGSKREVGRSSDRRADPPVGDSPVRQGEVPSMAQTRASVRRAIVSLSEQAAQSDDPTRAQDLLKGAREASEALAALEGTTGE
jgi:hypothetical protein